MTAEAKTRKTIGPMEIYADDNGVRTKLALEIPQELKSTDAVVRWLKKNAEVPGVYAIQRTLVRVKIDKNPVVETVAEVL